MNAPAVQFFAGRSESFVQEGARWRRMTPQDEAHACTGRDRETDEVTLGISISPRPNGLMKVEFDLFRLGANLRPETIERLRARWAKEASTFSKLLQKSVNRRAHFSKSFAQFEVSPERLEAWKSELSAVLENPDSYEPIESRIVADA